MMHTQRTIWNDRPERLSVAWTLDKPGGKVAECSVWSQAFGWELRLTINGSMIRTQVTRTAPEMLAAADECKRLMSETGWVERCGK